MGDGWEIMRGVWGGVGGAEGGRVSLPALQSPEEPTAEGEEEDIGEPHDEPRVGAGPIFQDAIAEHEQREVGDADGEAEAESDGCFPALGGDTEGQADDDKDEAGEGEAKAFV